MREARRRQELSSRVAHGGSARLLRENVNHVPASEHSAHDKHVAAKSNAEHDITASPSNESAAEAKPKSPSKPSNFKGRNDALRGGSNKPDGSITKVGGSVKK